MEELPIPAAATMDEKSVELVRVWAANGEQHVSIAHPMWDDPGAWGLILADLARHVALAYQQARGADPAAVRSRIKAAFEAEWAEPTNEHSGGLLS